MARAIVVVDVTDASLPFPSSYEDTAAAATRHKSPREKTKEEGRTLLVPQCCGGGELLLFDMSQIFTVKQLQQYCIEN